MIRPAVLTDFVDVVEIVREFYDAFLKPSGLKIETIAVLESVRKHTQHTFVLEVEGKVIGVLIGQVVDDPLQRTKIFQELIWYVRPEQRKQGIKLLRTVEDYCKATGIGAIVMSHTDTAHNVKFENFYRRRGYTYLESHYMKVLT